MTRRGGQTRVARLREQLESHELEVLGSLHQLRLLTARKLQRLHVVDGSVQARLRRTQYLMQRLSSLRLVVRFRHRVGGRRAGSAGYVYGLSGLGQAVLDQSGIYGKRRRGVWEGKPYFLHHVLTVSELYVRLVELIRARSDTRLLAFEAEPRCWRYFVSGSYETVTLKPDAYVCIGVPGFELRYFVEVDLSTESLPTIQRKCFRYISYWSTEREQHESGVFPQVVWLVLDERRKRSVASVVAKLREQARRIFWVALFEEGPRLLTYMPEGSEPSSVAEGGAAHASSSSGGLESGRGPPGVDH